MRLRSLVLIAALLSYSVLAASESAPYPTKPVRIVTGFAAGGPTDVIARAFADFMGREVKQPVIVENKTGANTVIAVDAVLAAPSDGYTLLAGATNITMIPALYADRIKFDVKSVFDPVCILAKSPTVLVVKPEYKIETLTELIADAKRNPGAITYATPGAGSSGHFATEEFSALAGIALNHIPYKGAAPAMNDLMAGQVDVSFATLASVLPQIKAGRIKAIAVASYERSKFLPDVPTFKESISRDNVVNNGIERFSADAWYGILAARGANESTLNKLQAIAQNFSSSDDARQRLDALGIDAVSLCGTPFLTQIRNEVDANIRLSKTLNLKLE